MHSIKIIITHFGPWPEWLPLFLETCRWNPTIDWLLQSDQPYRFGPVCNVQYRHMTVASYKALLRSKLGISPVLTTYYKVCDFRPTYGIVFKDDVAGYDFFGYGDLDVLYGDIRHFCSQSVLANHDIISTHNWCLSGHFALIRNTDWLVNAFRFIPQWKVLLQDERPCRFDEDVFTQALLALTTFSPSYCDSIVKGKHASLYLKEQFTTPLTPNLWLDGSLVHPRRWCWDSGHLTNDKDGSREFIYLHFMNYRTARHMSSAHGRHAPWLSLQRIVHSQPEVPVKRIYVDDTGMYSSQL